MPAARPIAEAEIAFDAALRAPLDEAARALRELRWEPPRTRLQAETVVAGLATTRDRLALVNGDSRLSAVGIAEDVAIIINKLTLATIGWEPRLSELAASGQEFGTDSAGALVAELRELARAGALVLDRIETLACEPHQPLPISASWQQQGLPASTRHRRALIQTARSGDSPLAAPPELERAPGSVVGLVRILYQYRIIGFSLAAGVAALALTALYYAAPHEHSSTVSVGGALESHSPKPTEAPRSSVPVVGESGLASATGRPRSTPAGGAGVSVLQISVLSGSASQQHVDAVISLQASTRSPVTVQISYWGQSGNDRTGQSWYSTVVSGALSYQVPIGIPTGAYCGDVVTVTASAGGQYAAQNTSPGC